MQPQNTLKVIPLEEVFLKKYVRNEKDDEMDLEVNTAEVSSQRLSRDLAMDVMTIGISLIGCASGKTFFRRFGHENVSTAILSLPLIQEGQLDVTDERMCTKYW